MKERLNKIKAEKKLQKKTWDDLSKGLEVSGEAIRLAFYRNSINDAYLDIIEQNLGIKERTKRTREDLDISDRFEDIITKKVLSELEPYFDKMIEAIAKMDIELTRIRILQEDTKEKVDSIEKRQ